LVKRVLASLILSFEDMTSVVDMLSKLFIVKESFVTDFTGAFLSVASVILMTL